MDFPNDLPSIASEAIRISHEVFDLTQRLEHAETLNPREYKVYEHLTEAYNALRAAIQECQPEARP